MKCTYEYRIGRTYEYTHVTHMDEWVARMKMLGLRTYEYVTHMDELVARINIGWVARAKIEWV